MVTGRKAAGKLTRRVDCFDKGTKQIALELHVSPKTIEANRRQIMEKLRPKLGG